jgi:hypothetical protein|tara:strand:- start:3405 stop:3674 length:270 start_codon:yes stop_codon:yes gene_type:complete
MKYIVTTWETLQCQYEVESTGKEQAWQDVLNNKGVQIDKMWSDEGSYVVKEKDLQNQEGVQLDPQVNFPGNVVDFKTKVRELLDKKGKK